jgi:hypothetical protein
MVSFNQLLRALIYSEECDMSAVYKQVRNVHGACNLLFWQELELQECVEYDPMVACNGTVVPGFSFGLIDNY